MKNGFIEQTANDYNMPYSEVEWIYKKWNDKRLFYEKLEDYIKERAQNKMINKKLNNGSGKY